MGCIKKMKYKENVKVPNVYEAKNGKNVGANLDKVVLGTTRKTLHGQTTATNAGQIVGNIIKKKKY